jgi:hypothetical protein
VIPSRIVLSFLYHNQGDPDKRKKSATTTVPNVTGPEPSDGNDNGNGVVDTYTAFITTIGTLVGTIGSIIGVVVVFIRDTRTKALAQQVGLGMVTFGQKTVENTDRIRNLAKVVYELSPEEAKEFLEQNRMKVEQLTESVGIRAVRGYQG